MRHLFLLASLAYAAPLSAQIRVPADEATIRGALNAAAAGDTIVVSAGTYDEALETRAPNVTLRADGEVVVRATGRVLDVQHEGLTVEGVVFDGGYGDRDAVRVQADGLTLRRVEVRRSGRDCVDMGSVSNIRIEGSSIHHCLASSRAGCDSDACRDDAHGITGASVREIDIIDTEIHTFSGDAIQFDPGRSDPGWRNVRIEGCTFWLAPLASAEGGFAAGVVPGENAVDTKTSDTVVEPATLSIVNTVAYGFRGGLISNMSAFNLKENVAATLDRITVYDSEIAFRIRGATGSRPRGAQVTVTNAVLYDLDRAVRYEDDLGPTILHHLTFGADIGEAFDRAGAPMDALDVRNALFLGPLPGEASAASNLSVDASSFVGGDDYHLTSGSPAIDAGEDLAVPSDRDGNARPSGSAPDVGAYEYCEPDCARAPDAGPRDAGGGVDAGGSSDAGGRDSGGRDAGGGDAGSAPTGGGDGCGCRTTSTGDALPFALAVFVFLRRRRPSRAPRG